jgi:hypothetical protein
MPHVVRLPPGPERLPGLPTIILGYLDPFQFSQHGSRPERLASLTSWSCERNRYTTAVYLQIYVIGRQVST